jgi:hypothetical protein
MGRSQSQRLGPLLLVAFGVVGAVVLTTTTLASGRADCATGSWPAAARSISPARPAAARVIFARGRWQLSLRPAASRALVGRVAADSGLSSVRGTAALRGRVHRSSRGLSFVLPGGSAPAALSFVARCAHRITFELAGGRTVVGRQPAPTPGFQLQRPPSTGVSGQMIAGPTCPVVGPGANCPPANRVQGTVEIDTTQSSRSSPAGTPVRTVSSDSNGNFSADLAPGAYTLTGRSPGPQPPAGTMSRSESVRVESGVVSQVTLTFDTGIR